MTDILTHEEVVPDSKCPGKLEFQDLPYGWIDESLYVCRRCKAEIWVGRKSNA
jgi:hypothetical protein